MASLQELPDDELDKLFRSSAEEFEPPYNPEDWNSLRQRLDDDDRSRFIYRFVYWGLPLLLLLLTTISLVVEPVVVRSAAKKPATHPEMVSAGKTGATQSASVEGNGRSAAGSVSAESGRSRRASEKTARPSVATNAEVGSAAGNNSREAEKPVDNRTVVNSKSETGSGTRLSKPVGSPDLVVENNAIPTKISARSLSKNRGRKPVRGENNRSGEAVSTLPVIEKTGSVRSETRKTVSGISKTGKIAYQDDPLAQPRLSGKTGDASPTGLSTDRPANPVSGSETPTSSNAGAGESTGDQTKEAPVLSSETRPFDLLGNLNFISARAPKKQPLPRLSELDLEPMLPPVGPRIVPPTIPVIGYPALSIRFIMAPDLNFVGDSPKAATDFEIGVVGEYRFARRFTIQSGVLRSVKKYNAPGKSYAKPPHWYGPMYESVDAVCTVLDIPVNLRFDVMVNQRRRWFVSAGLSSYIMQKERYEYNYPPGVMPNPGMTQYFSWSGKTGFHEWSHLNFSFGYERNFSSDGPLRRFSWQVEPFLKYARRSTLGYGKIRLTSAGVFFSLRYRL
ncbi:hypothetical protein [Larkinella terrae]|uniref:Outer membrane beta-barrel protein n=1 Tax=Larkinella terrae TaxID=2025311 RepID=A0A7K0EPI8_9BACT|nr:hypothetical protein [Larkinella terrae]MRS63406.1 hypothetical protein [Larkinella terrae]